MPQALLYADERALAAYLGGAALLQPELVRARCRLVRLTEEEREARGAGVGVVALAKKVLLFEDDLALPEPPESCPGTELRPATLDARRGVLTLEGAAGAVRLGVEPSEEGDGAARSLGSVLKPLPWTRPPVDPELVYLSRPGRPFADLVTEHLELQRDQLRYAPVWDASAEDGPDGGRRVLLDVGDPAWFILERWVPARHDEVVAYRRAHGALGPRRIYVEWGYQHPLEDWLADPRREDLVLLIDREGRQRTVEQGALQDVGQALALDPEALATTRLEPLEDDERVAVALRLEGRPTPLDPELWLLPLDQRERLEQLLAQTPEEELRNLLVACLERPGGEKMFAVREVLTGRAPRLLPLGERAYAPMPGLPNLLVPCDRTVAPPLSNDRYMRAFGLRGGELTVLDPAPDAAASAGADPAAGPVGGAPGIAVTRVEERFFQPVEAIVDFVVASDAERVAAVVRDTPFDLGRFAEEDLVPAQVPKRREERPRRERAAGAERSEERSAAPVERAERSKDKGLIGRIRHLFGAAEEEGAARPAGERDPRREAIARLEGELVLDEPTPRRWWELSVHLQREGELEEALRAAENAIWALSEEEQGEALRELEQRLGATEEGAPQDVMALYRRVLAYRRQVAQLAAGGDAADRYRQATERTYDELHQWEGRLRKKTRWLLWRLVLQETGDAIQEERQRENLLSELVLRGIEEREVPPFVRRVLLDHYGLKAATGSGAAEALAFLDGARRFAGGLGHPALRAESLSQVAWALAELGEPQRALDVAQEADRQAADTQGAPAHHAFRARARARVGAVLERVSGRDKGRRHLEQAFRTISRLVDGQQDINSQEAADAHKAFGAWFGVLADARGAGASGDDPLLRPALEELARRPPDKQVLVLAAAAPALLRLNAAGPGQRLARSLLQNERLKLMHLEDVVRALEVLEEGRPVAQEDAQAIVRALVANAEQVDEFSIDMLLVALRGLPGDPWEVIVRLRERLEQRGLHYQARLVRVAGLRRLAEQRDRKRGPELLAEALEDAWTHAGDQEGLERMRVVTRLAALVPAFGMRERGLRLLGDVKTRALEEPKAFNRNEFLMSAAEAASKLGESRSSFDLLREVAEQAIQTFEGARRGWNNPSWVLFETLQKCARGGADMGDARRGLALIETIAGAARTALEQAGGVHDVGRYFYCQTLIQCGHAALALGDREAAEGLFQETFQRLREFQGQDLIDLLQEAAQTAGQLDGSHRYELARQVLEAAEVPGEGGDLFERFAVDLTATIARDMVAGESAFAAALKRWKGREERAIRDRVAVERIAQRA